MKTWSAVLLPLGLSVALVLGLGLETRWGEAIKPPMPDLPLPTASAVDVSILPDYRMEAGLDQMAETAARPLFVPSRRPAPPAPPAAEETPEEVKIGQYLLVGTTVTGNLKHALLRDVATGKQIFVKQGDKIGETTVVEVAHNRVVLALGNEREELSLKVATSGAQPAVPASAALNQSRTGAVPGRGAVAQPVIPLPLRRRGGDDGSATRLRPRPRVPLVTPVPGQVQPSGGQSPGASAPGQGGTAFVRPPAELPSDLARRNANAEAAWREINERIRQQATRN